MHFQPYDNEHIAELRRGITAAGQHLADCRERRPTKYLADVMESWAGTRDIDFDYVASVISYGSEEDEINLSRGGFRLLEFEPQKENDPADWWKHNQ